MVDMGFVALVLGLVFAIILRRHFSDAKLLRLHEIQHVERMASMKQGLPISDSAEDLEHLRVSGDQTKERQMNGTTTQWTRLSALALGLIGLFGGIGTMIGLYYQTNTEIQPTWPLGLVPTLIGVGLLLFVHLSKGIIQHIEAAKEQP